MWSIKCEQCGASVPIEEGKNTATCPFCDTVICLPSGGRAGREGQMISARSLLQRAKMFLRDGDRIHAASYIEWVLNADASCSEAYWCRLMLKMGADRPEQMEKLERSIAQEPDFLRAVEFGSPEQRETYLACEEKIQQWLQGPEMKAKRENEQYRQEMLRRESAERAEIARALERNSAPETDNKEYGCALWVVAGAVLFMLLVVLLTKA